MTKHGLRIAVKACAASLLFGFAGHANAQTVIETSEETGFQLDFHVPDAALKALLPAGFIPSVAMQGPAKDANLRVVFLDRVTVHGPAGKPVRTGSEQLVYLLAPVKDANGAESQLVVGELSGDAADVPGPFGIAPLTTKHSMRRLVSSSDGPVLESQDWVFEAATGEHLEMHIEFERGAGFKLGPADVKFYSAKDASVYQISRQEQDLDILRNVTITPRDRVRRFSFKAGGGSYAPLFDGKEKLLSWDDILWTHRTMLAP